MEEKNSENDCSKQFSPSPTIGRKSPKGPNPFASKPKNSPRFNSPRVHRSPNQLESPLQDASSPAQSENSVRLRQVTEESLSSLRPRQITEDSLNDSETGELFVLKPVPSAISKENTVPAVTLKESTYAPFLPRIRGAHLPRRKEKLSFNQGQNSPDSEAESCISFGSSIPSTPEPVLRPRQELFLDSHCQNVTPTKGDFPLVQELLRSSSGNPILNPLTLSEIPETFHEWRSVLQKQALLTSPGLISRVLGSCSAPGVAPGCLWFRFQDGCNLRGWKDGDKAALCGHMPLLCLQEKSLRFTYQALAQACKSGTLEIVKWIHEKKPAKYSKDAMNFAAEKGFLEIVEWLHDYRDEGCSTYAMNNAARYGHFKVVEWLHLNRSEGCTEMAIDLAASGGHLDIVIWLDKNRSEGCSQRAMTGAAINGHLQVIEWLHKNRTEGCVKEALPLAAEKGHLDVARWLQKNIPDCAEPDPETVVWAAANGHLPVVEWFHESGFKGFSARVCDDAAKNGHLEVVEWLVKNRNEGVRKALDQAAGNGHQKVVEWLLSQGVGSLTHAAMDAAAGSGHLEMVQWLHTVALEGCTTKAMDSAAENGHLHILQWLHQNRSEGCTPSAYQLAEENCHLQVVAWLRQAYPQFCDANSVNNSEYANSDALFSTW